MPFVRLHTHFVDSVTDLGDAALADCEAHMRTILEALTTQQRNNVFIELTPLPTPSGGLWLIFSVMSPA